MPPGFRRYPPPLSPETVIDLARITVAAALTGFGLSGCVRARRVWVWHTALIATEYGAWFGLLAFAIAAVRFAATPLALAGSLLALLAGVLLLRPAVRAWWICRRNPDIKDAFSWLTLFFATNPEPVETERIRYAEHAGRPLHLHLYRPGKPRPGAPVLLYFHSGGWDSGTPHEFPNWFHALTDEGLTIAAAEYRLAPDHPWPAQRHDALAAIAYLKANAESLELPSRDILLWGRSAGGHIALCAAYRPQRDPAIRGVAAFYAPTDMFASWYHTYPNDMLDSHKLLSGFLGGIPRDTHDNHRDASPARLAPPDAPPTLLIHGGKDDVVWWLQRRLLSNRLRRNGTPVTTIDLPWAKHACDHNLRGPSGQICRHALLRFIDACSTPR